MSDRDFRLSKDILPSRYELRIEADLDTWRFSAAERIEVTVHRARADVVLHAVGPHA